MKEELTPEQLFEDHVVLCVEDLDDLAWTIQSTVHDLKLHHQRLLAAQSGIEATRVVLAREASSHML